MLYFIATPIGNLKDISYRAVETLKEVDEIACEDTRHSLTLLSAYGIKKPLFSYHKYNEREESERIIEKLKAEFEPKGIRVFGISAVSGENIREMLYYAYELLQTQGDEPIVYKPEFIYEQDNASNLPYTVSYDEEDKVYVVEGPRIERMLGYTNLDSEKGFDFFQNFLKDNGILEELEALGIQDKDTVRLYGWEFEYYK